MPDRSEMVTEARVSIRRSLSDPITRLLLNNSQLTAIQLETLLADALSGEVEAQKTQRQLFRPTKARISRGAYNRTLIQAQNNIIRSIYTILLLGYVGLFDSPALQPFTELSDTIQTYLHEAQQTSVPEPTVIEELNKRLLDSVSTLAKRQSFKDVL